MSSQVLPTKSYLLSQKNLLKLAKNGLNLMKKKQDILTSELLSISSKIKDLKDKASLLFSSAYLSLQKANISLGLVNNLIDSFKYDNNYTIKHKIIMGLSIPIISNDYKFKSKDINYSLIFSNSYFDQTVLDFIKVRDFIIELANMDTICYKLAININKTSKRTNSLEYVVIPNIIKNINYISSYIEEKEREDFSRNKQIKKNQQSKNNY